MAADISKVGTSEQSMSDKHFIAKAENMHLKKGKQIMAVKGKNKLVGLLLAGGVVGIYAYTMLSVRQGKMMEAFDKVPE